MNSIRRMIFSEWNAMRALRLLMGVFIGLNAIMMHDALSGLLCGIFLFQALTNTGCCCTRSCSIPLLKNNIQVETETMLEETKND